MAAKINQVRLYAGTPPAADSGGFQCIHLPPEMGMPAAQRESYVEINDGHLPVRARVWMTTSQFQELPETFRQGSTALGICFNGLTHDKDNPGNPAAQQQINFGPHFYLIDASLARTAVEDSDGNIEAIYEINLGTEQHWWMFKCLNLAFNMLSDDALEYAARAKGPGSPYTWQEIMNEIGSAMGVNFGTVPRDASDSIGSPQNQVFRFIPGGHAAHRLLQPLGMHIVCDPYSTGTLTYEIKKIEEDAAETTLLDNLADVALLDGSRSGTKGVTPNNRMPAKVNVLFPLNPLPPMDDERYCIYEKNNPDTTGTIADTIDQIFVGDHNCVCDENAKKYPEDLDALADERATAYFRRAAVPYEDYVFIGGYDFKPGASIRRVRMTMDVDGWFTTVQTHGLYIEPRQDLEKLFNKIKAPHWPEHGEPYNIEVDPRDDGTIDIRVPNLGACSSSSLSGSSSSQSSGSPSSPSAGSPSSASGPSQPSLGSLPSESSGGSGGSGASSAGSGGSAGGCPEGCVEVLKDVNVTFNAQTCEITIVKTKVCVAECPEEEAE